MVVSLGPGKFYGSSLPRPRYYKDDSDRVDPPVPVLDPLLSWANEAHWLMGGLSFARLRLQGRIEGSVAKLRAERERSIKKQSKMSESNAKVLKFNPPKPEINGNRKRAGSPSPPPAPIATKRRRYMALVDDSDEEEEESEVRMEKKRPARKLCEEFDRVSNDSEKMKNGSDATPLRTMSQGSKKGKCGDGVGDVVMKVVEDVNKELAEGKRSKKKSVAASVKRVSPRRAKAGESGSGAASVIRVSPRLAKRA